MEKEMFDGLDIGDLVEIVVPCKYHEDGRIFSGYDRAIGYVVHNAFGEVYLSNLQIGGLTEYNSESEGMRSNLHDRMNVTINESRFGEIPRGVMRIHTSEAKSVNVLRKYTPSEEPKNEEEVDSMEYNVLERVLQGKRVAGDFRSIEFRL